MTENTIKSRCQTPSAVPEAVPGNPAPRLRVALIGCGAIARSLHLPVLAGHEGVELAALVDRDMDRAGELARGYGVQRALADVEKLDPEQIDAAVLATPPFHHAPCAINLLRRGIHVLVEKPMATSSVDAEAMVRVAEEQGLVLSVGFFRRLLPSIRLLKSLLDCHWLGRPQGFAVEGGGMYSWAAATLGNMRKDFAGGGVLMDFGSHMVDLLFALFEEPAEVLEYRDNALGGVEADCSLRLRVRHDGKPVEGTVELARTRELGNRIRVECERGALEFDVLERYRVRVTPSGLTLSDPITGQPRPHWLEAGWVGVSEDEPWYETFRKQIDDWLEAIHTGREAKLSGRSALPTTRLIEECYRNPQALHEPWVWAGVGPREAGPGGNGHPGTSRRFAAGRNSALHRVLVTGASGFIGCRVAEVLRLRENCDVRAVVHNPGNASRLARLDVEMVQASLDSDRDINRLVEGCDAVVHCAVGTAWGDRRKIFSVTVEGTRRLAEAARKAGVRRFVHLSTMSVYGDDSALTGLLDEATPVRPVHGSEYGESKAQAEKVITRLAARGLSAVTLRPARVFGPFARIFITRPIQAIAHKRFRWLDSPDVPCDMVYVDNLVEVIVRSLLAAHASVAGETFNVGDGLRMTWREFYQHLAGALDLDFEGVPVCAPRSASRGGVGGAFLWPVSWLRGMRTILTSTEFKSLGRRVLQTDGVGTLPRWALERLPVLERGVRKLIKADDSLPRYRRQEPSPFDAVEMGSGGAVLSIEKARHVLGYQPVVTRELALELTLKWIRHAGLVGPSTATGR